MTSTKYDVLIIGGGVSGTALLYQLARFTDLSRLCLVEKYGGIAEVNSHAQNNSQTISTAATSKPTTPSTRPVRSSGPLTW